MAILVFTPMIGAIILVTIYLFSSYMYSLLKGWVSGNIPRYFSIPYQVLYLYYFCINVIIYKSTLDFILVTILNYKDSLGI